MLSRLFLGTVPGAFPLFLQFCAQAITTAIPALAGKVYDALLEEKGFAVP